MYSARDNAALPALGSPIRGSTGQRPFSASPWLIAAVHALHRLLVPRHPPYALTILTVIDSRRIGVGDTHLLANCAVFKVRKRRGPQAARPIQTRASDRGRSLKTQQHAAPPVDGGRSKLGRHARHAERAGDPPEGRPAGAGGLPVWELPRKEVIQPQLPLRLPCYDFTPITSPTFDGSLPEGLGHRLRVLPAFVV